NDTVRELYFQLIRSEHSGSNENLAGCSEGGFGKNRFAVERKVDQKRVFDSRLAGGEQETVASDKTHVQEGPRGFGKLQIAIESGNESPALCSPAHPKLSGMQRFACLSFPAGRRSEN